MKVQGLDDDFPSIIVHPERIVYRVHRAPNYPIFFLFSGLGRSDILGVAGLGTCYTSPSPIGACLETLGRLRTLTQSEIKEVVSPS